MKKDELIYEYEPELDLYFKDIGGKFKKFTNKEERDLIRKAQEGNKAALNKLIKNNLRFVVSVAKYYRGRGVPFSDLISEGNLGLVYAVNKFDVNKGVRFLSYAVCWIRYYIISHIEKNGLIPTVSIDDYSNDNYDNDNDDGKEDINFEFEESLTSIGDRKDCIVELLTCLKQRERKVVELSFGLHDGKEMTLDEISKETDISKERVRQIKEMAITKMKCFILSKDNSEFNSMKSLI